MQEEQSSRGICFRYCSVYPPQIWYKKIMMVQYEKFIIVHRLINR
ncbi:hypothetical protein BN13_2050002 [Nostocoides jenkinsii Ben 74]|uniref:Uncharacterized protein n=1 Tax=Nostocoides jenkinsii Ben 74 TaxID=1193518 RepID=A0A077MDA9_9MICO|nr:hypothetical protein BN13_2050002 [Tetrasphaera jenkinsii Ben 74]